MRNCECVSASVRECGSERHLVRTRHAAICHPEAQARRTPPHVEPRGPKDLACDTSRLGRGSAADAWAPAPERGNPGPGACRGAPHPQPFPRKLRGGREPVRRVKTIRCSGGRVWRVWVRSAGSGALPGCPLPRPLSRKRERGEFACAPPVRVLDACQRGRGGPVREGGLRAVVAANSFAPARPRRTPQLGPSPKAPCRCRAQGERHPRLDPTARVECTAGRFRALGPLDDNACCATMLPTRNSAIPSNPSPEVGGGVGRRSREERAASRPGERASRRSRECWG
jgi:hypothetical protein